MRLYVGRYFLTLMMPCRVEYVRIFLFQIYKCLGSSSFFNPKRIFWTKLHSSNISDVHGFVSFKIKPWSTPRLVLCFTFYGSFLIFCRARPISTLSAIWVLGRQRESHFGDLKTFWLIDSVFSFLVSHILLQRLIPFSLCLLWHILVFLLAVLL